MLFVFNLLSANLFFLQGAPRPCTPGILSYEKKVSKDSQGTCWFLDLQQKGAMPPSIPPEKHKTFVVNKGERHEVTVGRDNVIACEKIKLRVIVPKNGTAVPFFKRF